MKRSIMLLVIVLFPMIFAGSSAWAQGLTIPNTFTAGTTARASEVNQNFSAVAGALPIMWAETDPDFAGVNLTASGQVEINSMSIDAPSDGYLIISGKVFINNDDTSQRYSINPYVDGNSASAPGLAALFFAAANGDSVAELFTLSYTLSEPVTAGPHTVTQEAGPFTGTANFFYNAQELTVLFIPGGQGTITSTS